MRYKLLGLFSFVLLCVVGAWWHTCHIKYLCCDGQKPGCPAYQDSTAVTDTTLVEAVAVDTIATDTVAEVAPEHASAPTTPLPTQSLSFSYATGVAYTSLTVEQAKLFDQYKKALLAHPEAKLKVVGHTDNVGTAQRNQTLSERRAQGIADLLRREGLTKDRLIVVGYGQDKPIASNDTPEGRAQNRRVEVIVQP